MPEADLTPEELRELNLRLQIVQITQERNLVFGALTRVLQWAKLPPHVTARDVSSKDTTSVVMPTRSLATALRILRRGLDRPELPAITKRNPPCNTFLPGTEKGQKGTPKASPPFGNQDTPAC